MLVDDVTLECRGLDDIAVTELEMLDEETGAIERLLAANAGKLLIDLVVLKCVSMRKPPQLGYDTHQLDVPLQAGLTLELVTADAACLDS